MPRSNETKNITWHETCKYEYISDAVVCNNKQHWNKNKCRCKCKELIDRDVCDKEYIWNPSNCECECNKSCDFGECLDYKKCKCKKRTVDKLVQERTETIVSESKNKHNSCILHIVLFSVFFIINVRIGGCFAYYK